MLSETELQLLRDLDADCAEICEMNKRSDLSEAEQEYLRNLQKDILPGLAHLAELWSLKKALRSRKVSNPGT